MSLRELLVSKSPVRELGAELLQVLDAKGSCEVMRSFDRGGYLETLFPEISPMKGCTQNSYHHRDVWEHSLIVMENCETILDDLSEWFGDFGRQIEENLGRAHRFALLKLAAMLHDVGKPETKAINPQNGRITFYGHDKNGAAIIEKIGLRLELPDQDIAYLANIVSEHLHVLNLARPEVKKTSRMRWFRKMGEDVIPAIILGLADVKGTLGPDAGDRTGSHQLEWSRRTVNEYFTEAKNPAERPRLITGSDLIGLGIKPGREIGDILKRVEAALDSGAIHTREEALELVRQIIS